MGPLAIDRAGRRESIGRLFLLALNSGSSAAVRAFVARGTNLDARDSKGRTALMIAAARGSIESCRHLLDAGSDPLALDDAGSSAAAHARQSDNLAIADLIESFGKPPFRCYEPVPVVFDPRAADFNPDQLSVGRAPPSIVSPEPGSTSRISGTHVPAPDLPDVKARADLAFDVGEWEEDASPATPGQDDTALSLLSRLQDQLSSHHGEVEGDWWSDVRISLPDPRGDRRPVFSSSRRRRLEGALAPFADLATAILTPDEATACGLSESGLSVLSRTVEDAGFRVTGHDPWLDALEDPGMERSGAVAAILSEFEDRVAARQAPSAFALAVSQIPYLARNQEEGLWSAVDRSMDAALLEVGRSSEALQLVLAADALVRNGEMPFAFVSALDAHGAGDPAASEDLLDDGDQEDGNEQIEEQPGEVRLPDVYEKAIGIVRECASSLFDSSSAQPRRCMLALRECAMPVEFLGWIADGAMAAGKSDTATAIRRCAANVRRLGEQIAHFHLPHVVRQSERYVGRGLEQDDLVQEGTIGLLRAVQLFDRSKGHRFWTYAVWWVRQAMLRALQDKSRLIRIPVHVAEKLAKLEEAAELALQETGRTPTAEDISEATGVPAKIVRRIFRAAEPMLSLDDASGEWFAERLHAGRESDPFSAAADVDARAVISRSMGSLDPRQERVVRMRFGIGIPNDFTLEEVGQQFGVTRERIRQIESKALARLSHPGRSRSLRSLAED